MPLGSSKKTPRKAPWYIVTWIAVIVTVFSFSTISLAALGQGTTRGYAKDSGGILIALNDLRKEIRDIGVRILGIETKLSSRGLISTTSKVAASQPQESTNIPSRLGGPEPETKPTEPSEPPKEQVKEQTPTPPPAQEPVPPPKPDPQKEKNLNTCMQQCEGAFNKCIAATNETPLVPSPGNDFLCVENNEKECKGLCSDWYFYPAPTKLPVPPIESGAQTCLLNCRTEMSLCFKAAKIKYNVVDPKIPPPQAYFNELTDCVVKKDNACRAVCPAINPSAKAPTQ
jgi:hypothetical protein